MSFLAYLPGACLLAFFDRVVSHLDHQPRVEPIDLEGPIVHAVAARIAHHPAALDPVVKARMGMPMNPQHGYGKK